MRPLLKAVREGTLDTETLPALKETWTNIAFTAKGLKILGLRPDDFEDMAFKQGMARRSVRLGDPKDAHKDGHESQWQVGGKQNESDFMLIAGNIDKKTLTSAVTDIKQLLNESTVLIHSVMGARLKDDKEHFGFRDAISQPGLQGLDDSNPRKQRDLVAPGEFVFGYLAEDRAPGIPNWARDGSFLVFRRLRQDVQQFNDYLETNARGNGVDPEWLAAKLVGRWRSGAPLELAPDTDNKDLGEDEIASNAFSLTSDPSGQICPFASHIRKVYPRDDEGALSVNTHRLLRRGIPYDDGDHRGLLFMAYQTSIVNQFEHVMKEWAGNPNFNKKGTGADLLFGRAIGPKTFQINFKDRPLTLKRPDKPWIVPTGGGYFFAPSIQALRETFSQ